MKYFRYRKGKLRLPLFFPDATRAVVKTLDFNDVVNTKTPGVLVNTFHLFQELDHKILEIFGGIRSFMGWDGACISDSGGFQVMSLVKSKKVKGEISDKGIVLKESKRKERVFTPEDSIRFQFKLKTDLMVVLDDFTDPKERKSKAKETVARTIEWAKRSKKEFQRLCKLKNIKKGKRPYLISVVQGGKYLDLRRECTKALVEIGFDGLGYGGWPLDERGKFNYKVAEEIAKYTPKDYLLYGLGIGKPEEIVGCVKRGFHLFDCVLPTRDARHQRLYVFNCDSIEKIDVEKPNFYSFYQPSKAKYQKDNNPVSKACDCTLCTNYSKSYLSYLFRIKEMSALRLATIHNLRFYSLLMEKLQKK